MKQLHLSAALVSIVFSVSAQMNVQTLQPVRLSIFKNGTYFIKKESVVNVTGGTFIIPAPTNVLMGTYWLAAGKGAALKSIVIKEDTFRVDRKARSLQEYLNGNINGQVTVKLDVSNVDMQTISGTLLEYNEAGGILKIKTPDNKIIIVKENSINNLVFTGTAADKYRQDSIAVLARVSVNTQQETALASTLSLEKGIRWYPSYLLRIINDKEAKLEMKATIVNGGEDFKNTAVDIIIGSPEMFYGKELDPVCTDYLNTEIFKADNYQYNYAQFSNSLSTNNNNGYLSYPADAAGAAEEDPEDKQGEKLQDLFIYQLGKLDLEKNAKMIIPVLSTSLNYEDIYTADLAVNSSNQDDTPQDVFHKYRISNNGTAPFTTGAVLVISRDELPMAQSQLKYAPVKGSTEINLSKAIDVQVKNEEAEIKREGNAKRVGYNSYYDRVTYSGRIGIVNLQNKQIRIKIKKQLLGVTYEAGQNGKTTKTRDKKGSINPNSIIEWEITLQAGESKNLSYGYTTFAN